MLEIFHLKGSEWGNTESEDLIGSGCVTNARLGDFRI